MTNERDIVERLSDYDNCHDGDVDDAIGEITRLRTELEAEREAGRMLGVECEAWRRQFASAECKTDPCRICTACSEADANPLAAAHIAAAKKPETAPLECVTCGAASEKQHPVDSDHAGWLCPTCYAAAKKGDEQ